MAQAHALTDQHGRHIRLAIPSLAPWRCGVKGGVDTERFGTTGARLDLRHRYLLKNNVGVTNRHLGRRIGCFGKAKPCISRAMRTPEGFEQAVSNALFKEVNGQLTASMTNCRTNGRGNRAAKSQGAATAQVKRPPCEAGDENPGFHFTHRTTSTPDQAECSSSGQNPERMRAGHCCCDPRRPQNNLTICLVSGI